MCSDRQAFFFCFVENFDGLTECCNSGFFFWSLPFIARNFSCAHKWRLNSGFVGHLAVVEQRTCGQSQGENHDAGKAKELEKEFHRKMKKCFKD